MSYMISQRFNADDSDLVLQSSSGELFKVHKQNVELHSNILISNFVSITYPPSPIEKSSPVLSVPALAGTDTPPTVDRNSNSSTPIPTLPLPAFVASEVNAKVDAANDVPPTQEKPTPPSPQITLPESSLILDLLLQYMYNQPQPDLSQLDFDTLIELADAAEKYKVYAATEICRLYLRLAIPNHSLQVFSFSLKHRLTSLLDESAQYTVGTPLDTLFPILSQPNHLMAWMKYHRAWMEALTKVYGFRDPILRHWEGSPSASRASAATSTSHPHSANPANPANSAHPTPAPAQPAVIIPTTRLMANPCEVWAELWGTVAARIQGKPEMLVPRQMEEIWRGSRELLGLRCTACERLIVEWEAEWRHWIGRVPKFSSFL